MVRSWGIAATAAVLVACMLCMALLAHFSDADTLRDERRQQEMVASFTARTLGVRIETYQRVLQSMGQGIHSSMLDTPYLLGLLLREDAGYAGIFDTLVMTGSDGSMVTYAPSGGQPASGDALRDVLRRTLADGKPQVSRLVQTTDSTPQLGLLLTVPLRHSDGTVRGALAGLVRIGLHSLLPPQEDSSPDQQFMLVDSEGNLLAHSQADHVLGTMHDVLGRYAAQWPALSSFSTSNADSRLWGSLLVTRVGLPLPRWQVVVVQDMSSHLLGMRRLSPWQWLGLVATAVVVALLLLAVLWWLSRPLARLLSQGAREKARTLVPQSPGPVWGGEPQSGAEEPPEPVDVGNEAVRIHAHWQGLEQQRNASQHNALSLEAALIQVLETMPVGAVWARGNVLQHASRRAAWLLGYEARALSGMTLEQMLKGQQGAHQWARVAAQGMAGFGHYRGELAWQVRPGGLRWLQVEGIQLHAPALGSLWLLEDAQLPRQRREQSQWQAAHDAQTGVPNRHTLAQQLQTWCAAEEGSASGAQALLWVDVDYFKALNATAGRAAGDEVLRQVAWLLQKEQGQHGMVARVGADEFVLWLRQADAEAAVQSLAWRLCEAAQAWAPSFGGRSFVLGLSVGWLWTDVPAGDGQNLLLAAEAACRDAKRDGQSRAVQARLQHLQR